MLCWLIIIQIYDTLFQRILISTLAFPSEAGEKYALRLADFVHKRLKNEGTASVSLKHFPLCIYDMCIWPYEFLLGIRIAFIHMVMVVYYSSSSMFINSASNDDVLISPFMLMYILTLALTVTNFLLADMDQYFAKDFTHITPHCWISKSEILVSS